MIMHVVYLCRMNECDGVLLVALDLAVGLPVCVVQTVLLTCSNLIAHTFASWRGWWWLDPRWC